MKKMKGFRSIKSLIVLGSFVIVTIICAVMLIVSSVLSRDAFRAQVESDMQTLAQETSEKRIPRKRLQPFMRRGQKRQDLTSFSLLSLMVRVSTLHRVQKNLT